MSHRCSFTVKRWTDKRRAAHQTKSIVCLHVSFDLPICRRKWHFCPRNVWLRGTKAAAFVSYCSAVITFFVLFFGFFFFWQGFITWIVFMHISPTECITTRCCNKEGENNRALSSQDWADFSAHSLILFFFYPHIHAFNACICVWWSLFIYFPQCIISFEMHPSDCYLMWFVMTFIT